MNDSRLELPAVGTKIRVVLDTDTFNEIDDQFAVAHSVLSPERMELEAICAAPFHNASSRGPGDGMERSYAEIQELLRRLPPRPDLPVLRGATAWMSGPDSPVDNPASRHLIECALRDDPRPLYVAAIAAATNVASALLLEPAIRGRIVVVWLGGQSEHWPSTHEFNFSGDFHASRFLFDCGVPMIRIPCWSVASHLTVTIPELEAQLRGQNALADFLFERVRDYNTGNAAVWSKQIWDIAATGILIDPAWARCQIAPSLVVNDDSTFRRDDSRHPMSTVFHLNRDAIFRDLYEKIARA